MPLRKRERPVRDLLFWGIAAMLFLNCNTWTRIPGPLDPTALPTVVSALPMMQSGAQPEAVAVVPARVDRTPVGETQSQALPTQQPEAAESEAVSSLPEAGKPPPGAGEPAGCLSAAEQDALGSPQGMLDYASRLMGISVPFSERARPDSWNAYTGKLTWGTLGVVTLSVGDVENTFLIQRMMNTLQVAGFVTWLRRTEDAGLHILAIPLASPEVLQSEWAPYIQAYWQDRTSLPSGDAHVLPALKLPPCSWMVARGYAAPVDFSWWAGEPAGWPDYASAAAAYLANSNQEAARVAGKIDWLGERFPEGPDTMCGPLAWSILHDAGAFPPGWGEWQVGAKVFWLAKPDTNGRPWSLFPKDTYRVYAFHQPLGTFDFSNFPLYPGDFLYTYSAKDGFDHMLVVTEVDGAGNVYTVTNIVRVDPQKTTTIERVLLLNLYDPSQGIARNQWAHDKINGRTGHAGFEVFRWNWMEKDISGQPAAYTVQPGDTIGLVAARWKTPAEQIAEYNGVSVDAALLPGQPMMIPPINRTER